MAATLIRGASAPAARASGPDGGVHDDCRVCPLRPRCISYGWMSPGGIWFENAVVLRPAPGCRGYEGRGADILGRFGGAGSDDDATTDGTH